MSVARLARRGFLLALLALLVACGGAGPGDLDPLPRQATVLAFGNSVTHGTGAGPGEDFPSRLASITGWEVINAGVPGDRADTARSRIGEALRTHQPDLVIIELGGNDLLRGRSPEAVKEDLRALIEQTRRHGAQPLLIGVPRVSALRAATGSLRDDTLYRELASEEQVPLVADVLSGVLSDRGLRADAIHPNAPGYRRMAHEIAEALDDLGLWLAP
ncbi:MAG: GDSL-type esterase/lipase family protein [Pseudomonadota bacterium]